MSNHDTTIDIQTLHTSIRNDQFERNLEFFKKNQNIIYNKILKHQYKYFQLCLNPDKSFNVFDIKKSVLLYPSKQQDINDHFDELLANIQFDIHPYTLFFNNSDEDKIQNELLPLKTRFHQALYDAGNLKQFYDSSSNTIQLDFKHINFLPLLRVYGIGLGHHLLKVIQQYDISCLIINEPEFDLFYTSLYTVPWDEILSFFINDPNRQCLLSTDVFTISIQSEKNIIDNLHPFAYSSKASLNAGNGRNFSTLIDYENHYDRANFAKKAAGCYQDQITGFKNAILNLKKNMPFYNGKKQNKRIRVFLVGSGPSLNDSIHYLKQHQDDALVIACGSAISALVKNNIIPDIHVWQERHISKEYLLQYASIEAYKKIIGIRLNVVDLDIDGLYKNTLILQKAHDPGSTILSLKKYPLSYNVNPTVTNCGISLCPIIGASEVYLFGVDYGSSSDRSKVHADDTFVLADDEVFNKNLISIEGNFSKAVYANQFFIWSRDNAENEIAHAKHIKWINIGDGALIKGTKAVHVNELPAQLENKFHKHKVLLNIETLFDNHYSFETNQKKIIESHIPQTQAYLIAILDCFDSIPNTRCGAITTISLIVKAAINDDEDTYLPKKLFGIEFIRYLHDLYIQISLTESDLEAVELYENLSVVLKEHIEMIYQDFISIAQLIND